MSNEQFGVAELAEEMSMSRSNLLRKVKKLTKLSVSQLINQIRLKRSMELLRKSSMNVSEVAHQVGFGSTSYFIKCFREYYGYPPGEVGKRSEQAVHQAPDRRRRNVVIIAAAVLLAAAAIVGFIVRHNTSPATAPALEKSVAVLPFKNESNDSTNVYLINGLMESTINNLQQIKDLRVISRTTSEKYRRTTRSIPEMARELNVNYFIEGSGQKIGDQILLNIQLIDGTTDSHLWAKQYRREARDIFALQQEIAKNIAEEIQVIITPEEEQRIKKVPTENLVAYDLFLKGAEHLRKRDHESLMEAVAFFKKAIAEDSRFALAYAQLAISYYYLDEFKADKQYTDEIGSNADKALLYDPTLPESLASQALFYIHKKDYPQAVPYLEKALELNPNTVWVLAFLSDFYANILPNTAKYLEYSLMEIKAGLGSTDSVATSYSYLRLGNALAQNGFIDESLKYIDKSLEYNPANPFSRYVRAFVVYAKDGDLNRTRQLLIEEYNKDTTRIDILQDIGKVSYFMRDYETAYLYYKKLIARRKALQLDIYEHENLNIAMVLAEMGLREESEEYIRRFKEYADKEQSIYKDLMLSGYYIVRKDAKKAIEHMTLFSKKDNVQYWLVLFYDQDPAIGDIKRLPEFQQAVEDMKARFWNNHKKVRASLEEKGLI